MADGRLKSYLGCGAVADRPAVPDIPVGTQALWRDDTTHEISWWNPSTAAWEVDPSIFVDAPSDGNQYARQGGEWTEVVASGGGDASFPPFAGNATKVLTVKGDESGVEWDTPTGGGGGGGESGALVFLGKVVTAGSQTFVRFSAIPQNFDSLQIVWSARGVNSNNTASAPLAIQFNNDTTSGLYKGSFLGTYGNTPSTFGGSGSASFAQVGFVSQAGLGQGPGAGTMSIPNYTSALNKSMNWACGCDQGNVGPLQGFGWYEWQKPDAITQIDLSMTTGEGFADGSVFYLYGLADQSEGTGSSLPALVGNGGKGLAVKADASAVVWATPVVPGLVEIARVLLTADAPIIDFINIPNIYHDLELRYSIQSPYIAADNQLQLKINNDTAADYDWMKTIRFGNIGPSYNQTGFALDNVPPSATAGATPGMNQGTLVIPEYAATNQAKFLKADYLVRFVPSVGSGGSYGADFAPGQIVGNWNVHDAINRLTLFGGGNLKAGSVATLYGRGGGHAYLEDITFPEVFG